MTDGAEEELSLVRETKQTDEANFRVLHWVKTKKGYE